MLIITHHVFFYNCVQFFFVCFCLPSCIEVRAWLTVCWLERRQFFSWAAAVCGEEAGLTIELTEFTSGVEGRDDEGPGDPGDDGSVILLPTWLLPLPPPPTGLDKHEPREAPAPNGALQRREILFCFFCWIFHKIKDIYWFLPLKNIHWFRNRNVYVFLLCLTLVQAEISQQL